MKKASAGILLPPPAIYLIFVLLAWALGRQWPWPLGWPAWVVALAWVAMALGVGLMLWAVWAMWQRRTTVNPYGCPEQLVAAGPFRFSRNPIYLGDTLVYAGIALLLGSLWPWLLLPVLIVTMNRAIIRREERLLETLFGQGYRDYCRQVRRWL